MTYALVALLGIAVGVSELLSRYRDAPWRTLSQGASIVYLLINGLASFLALFLMKTFGWAACEGALRSAIDLLGAEILRP